MELNRRLYPVLDKEVEPISSLPRATSRWLLLHSSRIPAPLGFNLTWWDHSNSLHLCHLLTLPSSTDVVDTCLATPSPTIILADFAGPMNTPLASQFLQRVSSSEQPLHSTLATAPTGPTVDNARPCPVIALTQKVGHSLFWLLHFPILRILFGFQTCYAIFIVSCSPQIFWADSYFFKHSKHSFFIIWVW